MNSLTLTTANGNTLAMRLATLDECEPGTPIVAYFAPDGHLIRRADLGEWIHMAELRPVTCTHIQWPEISNWHVNAILETSDLIRYWISREVIRTDGTQLIQHAIFTEHYTGHEDFTLRRIVSDINWEANDWPEKWRVSTSRETVAEACKTFQHMERRAWLQQMQDSAAQPPYRLTEDDLDNGELESFPLYPPPNYSGTALQWNAACEQAGLMHGEHWYDQCSATRSQYIQLLHSLRLPVPDDWLQPA